MAPGSGARVDGEAAAGRGVEDGGAARSVGAAVSLHRVVLGVGHAEDGNVCLGREGGEGSGQREVESRRGTLRKKTRSFSTAFVHNGISPPRIWANPGFG